LLTLPNAYWLYATWLSPAWLSSTRLDSLHTTLSPTRLDRPARGFPATCTLSDTHRLRLGRIGSGKIMRDQKGCNHRSYPGQLFDEFAPLLIGPVFSLLRFLRVRIFIMLFHLSPPFGTFLTGNLNKCIYIQKNKVKSNISNIPKTLG